MKIKIETPDENEIKKLGVYDWPIWEAPPSTFPWSYDSTEMCYVLEGKVIVTTDDQTVELLPGILAIFPDGLDCEWKVLEKIKKHYTFT